MSAINRIEERGERFSRSEELRIIFPGFSVSGDQGDVAIGIGANCLEERVDGVEESVAGSTSVNVSQRDPRERKWEYVLGDILCGRDVIKYQVPLVEGGFVLVGRLLVEPAHEVRALSSKKRLRQRISLVDPLSVGKALGVAVSMQKHSVNEVRMIQHELLDGGSSSRAGVSDLMESPKKWEPGVETADPAIVCR